VLEGVGGTNGAGGELGHVEKRREYARSGMEGSEEESLPRKRGD